jgi:hypothetical protein
MTPLRSLESVSRTLAVQEPRPDRRSDRSGGATQIGSVLVLPLLHEEVLYAASNAAWDTYVITPASFEHLGPAIQDLVLYFDIASYNSVIYKVILQTRHEGSWSDTETIINEVTPAATGPTVYTPTIARGKWNVSSRLVLQTKSTTAQVTAKLVVSITVAVRLYTT